MNRRAMISLVATVFGSTLLGCTGAGAQQSDEDKIKAAINAYHEAISALDIAKMEPIWAHDPYVMAIQPRTTTIAVGWDDVKNAWEGTFALWTELKITQKEGPHIHIN